MIQIKAVFPDGMSQCITEREGITAQQLIQKYNIETAAPILTCRINQCSSRLDTPIMENSTVYLDTLQTSYANMAYQETLSLVYRKAIHDLFGKDVQVTINNSLSKGLFTEIHIPHITDEICEQVTLQMQQIIDADLPIVEVCLLREQLLPYLKKKHMEEYDLVESAYDLETAYFDTVGEETSVFCQHLLPSTRYLQYFEVRRYRNGVLLRFPHPSDPTHIPPYEEQKLLYDAFAEETRWDKLTGINYASDLNQNVRTKELKDAVLLNEALHEKKIAEIADEIHQKGKRIILIAGPSSSGKTTFAKRLCIQLRVIGLRPLYLGTDDYFINRCDMVPNADGKLDFEGLSAVDTALFTEQMNALLEGKKVDLPTFDFMEGKKMYGKRIVSIDAAQPIVIEGIHGLNPALTQGIPEDAKFRIYISPLTQINIDSLLRVPTTDARMLRRIVRDYRTRGKSAAETIREWPSVRKGEDYNIFPYNANADAFFNSQCVYELAVLKKYAEPLLKNIDSQEDVYPEAQRMLKFLSFFVAVQEDKWIPNPSIVREFIGGSSILDEL